MPNSQINLTTLSTLQTDKRTNKQHNNIAFLSYRANSKISKKPQNGCIREKATGYDICNLMKYFFGHDQAT